MAKMKSRPVRWREAASEAREKIKFQREYAGRYYAHVGHAGRAVDIVIREYVAGDWETTMNGQHVGYNGTKADAVAAAPARLERYLAETKEAR